MALWPFGMGSSPLLEQVHTGAIAIFVIDIENCRNAKPGRAGSQAPSVLHLPVSPRRSLFST